MAQQEDSPVLTLPIWGEARLLKAGDDLAVRPRALALLYYLALEGPTTREKLVELLWDRQAAPGNLSMELAYLTGLLEREGVRGLAWWDDPVKLPRIILPVVDAQPHGDAVPLDGLDEVSDAYQSWLEWTRHQLTEASPSGFHALPIQIAIRTKPPFVLLVRPQLGGNVTAFARELAGVMQMEYREALGQEPALYCPPRPYPPDLAEQILPNQHAIYILEIPLLGEIPAPLTDLRLRFPPRQTRLLKLPALSWMEARNGILRGLPFRLAARMYLAAQGNPGYLEALRELEAGVEGDGELPVPPHIREQLQFKLTLLTPDARNTVERVSTHPAPVSEHLFLRLSGQRVLQELKRHGWLVFNSMDSQWTVRSELVRQVVYSTLHPERQRTYHQQLANYFRGVGDQYCAAYHDCMARGDDRLGEALAFDSAWAKLAFEKWLARRSGVQAEEEQATLEVPRRALEVGPPLRLRPMVGNSEVEQDGALLTLKRNPFFTDETQISWQLPSHPTLVRIRGQGYCGSPLGSGTSGKAVPLEVQFSRLSSRIVLADVSGPFAGSDGEIVLPVEPGFDFWTLLPAGGYLTVRSAAELGLFELEVDAYGVETEGRGADVRSVEALDLVAFDDSGVTGRVPQS